MALVWLKGEVKSCTEMICRGEKDDGNLAQTFLKSEIEAIEQIQG